MRRILPAIALLFVAPQTRAQETAPENPRISIVQPGAEFLKRDLKNLIDLTDARDRKQWPNLRDFLDTFLGGVDTRKPIRVDVMLGQTARFVASFPITSEADFRENIDLLGITTRKKSGMYQCSDVIDGWLAFRDKYATIAESANDLRKFAQPMAAVAGLLNKKYDMSAELVNEKTDKASISARRESFEATQREVLAGIKRRPSESNAEYNVRFTTAKHQLAEAQRLFAEAQRIEVGTKYDPNRKVSNFTVEAFAIAGTDLENSIKQFNQRASHFASVPAPRDSVLSLRINHPLDEMRKEHLNEFFRTGMAAVQEEIDKSSRSGNQKAAAKELALGIRDLLVAGTRMGFIDLFVDVIPSGNGQYTAYGSVVTPGFSEEIVKLVKLIPSIRTGDSAQINVESVGNVKLHKARIVTDYEDEFASLFGNNPQTWLGTGPDTLWFAVGPDAQAVLKANIQSVGRGGAGEDRVVDIEAKLYDVMKVLDLFRSAAPRGRTSAERTIQDEQKALRESALLSMKDGSDKVKIEFTRQQNKVMGGISFEAGILRFVGAQLAKFSRENLEF